MLKGNEKKIRKTGAAAKETTKLKRLLKGVERELAKHKQESVNYKN